MNEQIKLLAEQAGIRTNLEFFEKDPNKWVDYFAEKFAELIIEECADILRDPCAAAEIKEHFGVE